MHNYSTTPIKVEKFFLAPLRIIMITIIITDAIFLVYEKNSVVDQISSRILSNFHMSKRP